MILNPQKAMNNNNKPKEKKKKIYAYLFCLSVFLVCVDPVTVIDIHQGCTHHSRAPLTLLFILEFCVFKMYEIIKKNGRYSHFKYSQVQVQLHPKKYSIQLYCF